MPVANHMMNEAFLFIILQRGVWCLLLCSRGFGAMSAGGWIPAALSFFALLFQSFNCDVTKKTLRHELLSARLCMFEIYIDLSVYFRILAWIVHLD